MIGGQGQGSLQRFGHQRRCNPTQRGQPQQPSEKTRTRQNLCEEPTVETLKHGSIVVALNDFSSVVNQMHVIDTRRTGRRTSQTAQTAVQMVHHILGRFAPVFQHVFEQVDPPPRAVEFVAKQLVGRTGACAQTTVNAITKNRFRTLRFGILYHAFFEECLHGLEPSVHATGV